MSRYTEKMEYLPLNILFCAVIVFWIFLIWDSFRKKENIPQGVPRREGIPYTESVIEPEAY